MKATISYSGILEISAENEMECYTLRRWKDENKDSKDEITTENISIASMFEEGDFDETKK